MAQSVVEEWFDQLPPDRQLAWLAIGPPMFRIPEDLVFTVPAQYREAWLLVSYLGFGETTASWFPTGPLAQLLIARRYESRRYESGAPRRRVVRQPRARGV